MLIKWLVSAGVAPVAGGAQGAGHPRVLLLGRGGVWCRVAAEPCPLPRREALAGGVHQRGQERPVHRAPAAVRPQRGHAVLSPADPRSHPRHPRPCTRSLSLARSLRSPLCPHSPLWDES